MKEKLLSLFNRFFKDSDELSEEEKTTNKNVKKVKFAFIFLLSIIVFFIFSVITKENDTDKNQELAENGVIDKKDISPSSPTAYGKDVSMEDLMYKSVLQKAKTKPNELTENEIAILKQANKTDSLQTTATPTSNNQNVNKLLGLMDGESSKMVNDFAKAGGLPTTEESLPQTANPRVANFYRSNSFNNATTGNPYIANNSPSISSVMSKLSTNTQPQGNAFPMNATQPQNTTAPFYAEVAMTNLNSPYVLRAGTDIPVYAAAEINTDDCNGLLVAIVKRDVYNTFSNQLIIPGGSRILGQCQGAIQGQERISLTWNILQLPNGKEITLGGKALDANGTTGIAADVNNHLWKIMGNSIMLSLFTSGTGISASDGTYKENLKSSVITQAQNLSNQILQRNINIAPTLRVPKGTSFIVQLAKSHDFKVPYTDEINYNNP